MASTSEISENLAGLGLSENQTANPEEAKAAVRKHGWTQPTPFEYEKYVQDANRRDAQVGSGEPEGADNGDTPRAPVTPYLTDDIAEWGSTAARYEWQDEYGDVGPAFPALEAQLFGNASAAAELNYAKISSVPTDVVIDSIAQIAPVTKFENAGLHPVMLENIKLCGYRAPTPVQAYCLPAVLQGQDIIAIAQTGSGKTAAFLIPTISRLMGKAKKLAASRPNPASGAFNPREHRVRAEPLILVICPTRELAVQIFDEARRLCYRSMLRPCVAYGGVPRVEQMNELRKGCDILIGTPGRLADFLSVGNLLSLNRVKYTIADEADELVKSDWSDVMQVLISGGDNNEDDDHTYMMFSATFPKEARLLAKNLLRNNHVRVRISRPGAAVTDIEQSVYFVAEPNKRQALFDLLMSMPVTRTIVFVNSKKMADLVDDYLFNLGLPSTSIHADRTQREREDALRAFRRGKAPIMVATGVSARGLDVKNVCHIINYELPSTTHDGIDEYVHRIGRTARIGNAGLASSFYNERNEDLAPALVKVLIESKQTVPEFLEIYKPDGGALDFEDESEEEDESESNNDGAPTEEVVTPQVTNGTTTSAQVSAAPVEAAW
ncbi:hypothetical protein MMC25_007215 [Agyrium rufum]|nr:hypothetical protein [Agyrium rufum]